MRGRGPDSESLDPGRRRKSRSVSRSGDHKGSAGTMTMGNLRGYVAAKQCVALRSGV